jgi:hypothetical protein
MTVRLEKIRFNHDTGSATGDALSIRKNYNTEVPEYEWVRGVSLRHEDSLAAYAINEIDKGGGKITIKARFSNTGSEGTIGVRAKSLSLAPGGGSSSTLPGCLVPFKELFRIMYMAAVGSLGDIGEQLVEFDNGQSGDMELTLKNPRLKQAGVGFHFTTWEWEYNLFDNKGWRPLETTRHKIYVVLDVPAEPWQQKPATSEMYRLPWADALDFACAWAMNARDKDDAAKKITEHVYDLGGSRLTYTGAPVYFNGSVFELAEFLSRAGGEAGLGANVGCVDMAAAVTTLSNILGCDLVYAHISDTEYAATNTPFECNYIKPIGIDRWLRPSTPYSILGSVPVLANGWGYHAVAWKGKCGVDSEVFDACLQLDSTQKHDPPKQPPPNTPGIQPAGMKFGQIGTLLYRDRLASVEKMTGVDGTEKTGRERCNPQPSSQIKLDIR